LSHFECIELESADAASTIKFKDKRVMDPARIERLGKELEQIASAPSGQKLMVDFENVRFISSAAISKLVVFEKRIRANGGKLRLSKMRPEVRDVFDLARLDTVFDIDD
jgi:anti-sigma B factor antagonist